jgi:hypothetical protein
MQAVELGRKPRHLFYFGSNRGSVWAAAARLKKGSLVAHCLPNVITSTWDRWRTAQARRFQSE